MTKAEKMLILAKAKKECAMSRLGKTKSDQAAAEEHPRAHKRSINGYSLEEDELEFINAVNAYKKKYSKPFPTWSEILHILKSLGYEKAGS